MGLFFSKKKESVTYYLPDPFNGCYPQLMEIHKNRCTYCKTCFYNRDSLDNHNNIYHYED